MSSNLKITFWGSSLFSIFVLEELRTLGLLPTLIITTPDKPGGRGLKLTAAPVKTWAEMNKIDCLSPEKLDEAFIMQLKTYGPDLSLVASYGKIIPKNLLGLPKFGTLNIHPSLLPKYRGPSPIQTQILNDDREVGVTLMLMDEEVDHGPIIAQEKCEVQNWPPKTEDLKLVTAKSGAKLFAHVLADWSGGKIKATKQDHTRATFTKKIEKIDGLIDLETGNHYQNFLKIQAYHLWPQAYFFAVKGDKKIRVIVKGAEFANAVLTLKKVLPEGKKEMNYEDFLRGLR